MRLLFRSTIAAALVIATTACFGLGYDNPTVPTTIIVVRPQPAAVSASVTYGTGNGAGRAFLVIHVVDRSGHGIAVPVTVTVANGTVSPGSSVVGIPPDKTITVTTEDGFGDAQVTVVGRGSVIVGLATDTVSNTLALSIP